MKQISLFDVKLTKCVEILISLSVHLWTHEVDSVLTVISPPHKLCLVHVLSRGLIAVLLTPEDPHQPLLQGGPVDGGDGAGEVPQSAPLRPAVDGVVLLLK